jgi:hypothetical protein
MTGSISRRFAAGTAVALVTAAAAVPSALAGGEPKNQAPFTRPVAARGLTQQLVQSHATSAISIRGEAKNQAPFIRLHPAGGIVIHGEPKNESPFTRR